ncbi:hypothetical protein ACVILK_002030 [Bradyrhizobium embrapense]
MLTPVVLSLLIANTMAAAGAAVAAELVRILEDPYRPNSTMAAGE